MGRLIMWNLMTLDGFFEGAKSWQLDWHMQVWGEELERLSIEQLHSAERLLFGRVTYEGMAAYWQTATGEVEVAHLMNTLPKTVFSRTLERADWANTTLVRSDAPAAVAELKREVRGDMYVFGSAKLSASLMEHDLFDELRIALVPVVIGNGAPLFARDLPRRSFTLVESRPLTSGCMILRYKPARG